MPVAGPETLVAAPPLVPPPSGLLATLEHLGLVVEHAVSDEGPNGAATIPEHWLAGIRFEPASIAALEKFDLCAGLALLGSNTHKAPRAYAPFALSVADSCSSWGWQDDNFAERATEALLAKEVAGIETEFERGALNAANPRLADAADPVLTTLNGGAATSPASALALLDEAIGVVNIGLGLIHATPYVFALWGNAQLLREGPSPDVAHSVALSPAGNLVVSGNGYLGASPANVVDGTHGVQWAYATDLMVVHRSATPTVYPATLREALDRSGNTVTYRAQRPYAIAWAGLLHAAVAVVTTPGSSTSSTSVDVSDRASRINGGVTITGATIAVPVDVQSLYRTQAFVTDATLAAAAVYTSAGVDGLNMRRLTGTVFADVAGSLVIQHSSDNAVWEALPAIAVAAGAAQGYDVPVYSRYVRAVYTNGAGAQTAFRLNGYLAAA